MTTPNLPDRARVPTPDAGDIVEVRGRYQASPPALLVDGVSTQ